MVLFGALMLTCSLNLLHIALKSACSALILIFPCSIDANKVSDIRITVLALQCTKVFLGLDTRISPR